MSDHVEDGSPSLEKSQSRIVMPERQRVEEALVQSKLEVEQKFAAQSIDIHLLRASIEATSEGILILDAQGKVKEFNHSLVNLLQVPEASLQNGDEALSYNAFAQLFEDADQIRARFDAIHTSSLLESHDVLRDKLGRVLSFSSYVKVADGALIGRIWNVREVT